MELRPGEPFDRYLVEALLGQGGMGQVYRARDDRLRRRVALKIISGAAGTDGSTRLLREARAAAAIDHPNAIAIFDVGEVDGTPFLAMELVEGATLRRFVGDASVSVTQRLHWLLAVARALAAAHERGIVHRDIKPENVMVRSDGLVKVLDFGIARPMTPPKTGTPADGAPLARVHPSLSALSFASIESTMMGTPLYMSPEQLCGEPLDGRSDQFAWGVVAWEVLAGKLPWSLDRGGPAVVDEIFSKDPEPLAMFAPVPAAAQAVVARAMRKHATDRFETTAALVAALEGALGVDAFAPSSAPRAISMSPTAHTVSGRWTQTLRTHRPAVLLGAVIALTAVAAAVVWRLRVARPADDATLALVAGGHRPVVAVLGAPSHGAGDARLSALPDLLATELASGGEIRVVPREVSARAAAGSAPSERPSSELLARMRDTADADYVVVVDPQGREQRVHLVSRVLAVPRAGAGEQTVEVTTDGDLADVATLVARAGDAVRRTLGRTPLGPEEAEALRAALPKSSVAIEAYAAGLACRARYDYKGSRDAFARAVAAEDGFALGHLELSRALTTLGFDRQALDEATRAMALSGPLGREQRLVITAQHAVAAKDWSTATETFRTLFGFFPDNLDYGLMYVRSQVFLGKRAEAFATLDQLRAVPRTAVDEARIAGMEAFVAAKVGDVRRRLAVSLEEKRKADALGATWIGGDARLGIAEAYRDLGEIDKGAEDLEWARAAFEKLGDGAKLAVVYKEQSDLAVARGDHDGALALIQKAVETSREVGNAYGTAGAVTHRGLLLMRLGRFREGLATFDEARSAYEAIHDIEGVAHNTGNAAEARIALGELAGARADFERALAMHREIAMKVGVEEQLLNLGWAQYLGGEAEGAGKTIEDALAQARAIGADEDTRVALLRHAHWLRARDDAPGAAREYEEAAAMAGKAGDQDARAEIELALGRLQLDRAKDGEPATRARAAVERFVASRLPHDEALARAVLVRALLRQGSVDAAGREAEALAPALAGCELFDARVEGGLARAELAAARGDREGAARVARETRELAAASGIVPLALEARLVEATLTRDTAALAGLARDARSGGYLRMVRLARR